MTPEEKELLLQSLGMHNIFAQLTETQRYNKKHFFII